MWLRQAAMVVALLGPSAAAADVPKVVASITPVHSLVASVMQGVGTPTLLVKGAGSPHSYALKPSEARELNEADIVVWIGGGMEGFLSKPVATLSRSTRIITLKRLPDVALLPTRKGGAWEEDEHTEGEAHAGNDHHHAKSATADHADGAHDLHLWLDPANAKAILGSIAQTLAEADPTNAKRYTANAEAARTRIDALQSQIEATLAPVRRLPFIVFHDAYQYFETRFGLNAAGSITLNPERKPGAKRLYDIRRRIIESGARCVFQEPQFEPKLIHTVIEGTSAKVGVLDPLGAEVRQGPDAYATILRNLADALHDCLTSAS